MADHLHLVFSIPPSWLAEADYHAWYDAHLAEILVVPGFAAARRYRLTPTVGTQPPAAFPFLSAYELDREPAEVMGHLADEERSGRMQLPEWFGEIRFASFNCYSLGNGADVALADHLYLVLSAPPAGVDEGAYVEWYREHAADNTRIPGIERAWRFRLEPAVVDQDGPGTSSHLAAYEVSADLPALRAALDEARSSGEAGFPAWFGQIPFVALDAAALGPRVAATEALPAQN